MESNQNKSTKHGPPDKSLTAFPVVGVGASAGGLQAFRMILKSIPGNTGMAFILVQHLDPTHESQLPDLLQKATDIPVLEISDDLNVEPDHIYIIPSNKMLVVKDGVLELSLRPAKNPRGQNPVIDTFFTSLAEVYQSHAVGVVLSGTASDGTAGLKAIRDYGGITFAQDEESAEYTAMPNNAVQAGVVDFILPPDKIVPKLVELTKSMFGNHIDGQQISPSDADLFKQIVSLLRVRKGTDFTYYKQSTIHRRILRRMVLKKQAELASYLNYLREHRAEQDELYQDLLISVTDFFRDPGIFEYLCDSVFPTIVKDKVADEAIRIWVAGSSTGEEAYSIAICLKEFLGDREDKVQIFATDISEPVIAAARAGIYDKKDVKNVSSQRLQEFFTKTNGGFQLKKQIRDMCVFAVHNFLQDPPFGKMDFISCRNVLIYMETYLQKKALTTFHYALNAKGFLLLGKSETTSSVSDLFVAEVKGKKLFVRKDVPGKFMLAASRRSEQRIRDTDTNLKEENVRTDFQKVADHILLTKYTPAGVVVNEAMDIVHFRGSTGAYLEQSPGKPTHNLLKMAKLGLAFELRNLLHKAKTKGGTVIKEHINVDVNGRVRVINIEVVPLANLVEPHYLVLFHDSIPIESVKSQTLSSDALSKTKKSDKDLRIRQLEQELADIREDMRSITEDQEAANEELQSANEELLSGSEELQSLNEELETSKEELQSTNEELMVVNQELNGSNEQLAAARDYAESIVETVREPLLVLDKKLRIRTANSAFYRIFQTREDVTEGRLIYEIGEGQWDIPELRAMFEKILPERENLSDFEVSYNRLATTGVRTMLLNAREIKRDNGDEKLILLAIEEITERKKAELAIRESEAYFRKLADLMPEKINTADDKGNVNYYNQHWLDDTGASFKEMEGWGWDKFVHPNDLEEASKKWQYAIETGRDFEHEIRFLNKEGNYKWHLSRAIAIKDDSGGIKMWIGTNTDIQRLKDEERRKGEFLKMVSHELKTPITSMKGYVQVLLGMLKDDDGPQPPSLQLKPLLRRVDTQIGQLNRLLSEILDLSRSEESTRVLQNEMFSINELVDETVQDLRYVGTRHTICAEHEINCGVVGDRSRIGQVIINLVNNAIKYSPEDTEIEVRVCATGKDRVSVSVKDKGIGIDKREQKKIFQRFYQSVRKDGQSNTGFGIGLYLSNEIIHRHGGVLKVESKKGEGSTFTFTIRREIDDKQK